ncbi:MAG: AMP-binding protein [Lachnospiraceae bacterium]|nr:AMP-binding protein [Lachnospiraceae bacterium]
MQTQLKNLLDFVRAVTKEYGDRDVYRFKRGGQTMSRTYKQFEHDIEVLATWMIRKGWKNKHIAILGGTSYEWVTTFLAVCISSNIAVPIDRLLPKEDILNLMVMGDIDYVFVDEEFEILMRDIRDAKNRVQEVFSFTGSEYRSIMRTEPASIPAPDPDACCEILFTSGTTGHSKGVCITQRNIVANIMEIGRMDYTQGVDGDPVVLSVLPIHHTFELTVDNLGVMISGATICINDKLENIVTNMQEFKPAVILIVPAIAEAFYKKVVDATEHGKNRKKVRRAKQLDHMLQAVHIDARRKLFKSLLERFGGNLRSIVVGGAALRPEIVNLFEEFGINVFQGYGLTECAPIVAANYPYHNRPGSVGQVVSYMKVKISEGEILVRGDGVMQGYYKNQEATDEAVRDGWFHTGDLGYLDQDGYLYITGRSKNLIILDNGKNVYPEELEDQVNQIDHVKECMVYAEDGRINVLIYPENPRDNQETYEIKKSIRALNEDLPSYKRITAVRFMHQEFPKTTTLKIKRKEVMKWLAENRQEDTTDYAPPVTAAQKLLADSFERALSRRKIGIRDDFFALGGDSLSACIVAAETGLSVQDIYENPTIEQLAGALSSNGKKKESEESHIDVNALIRRNSNLQYNVKPQYVLLTGATGFLGSHILRELNKRNINVVCLVRDESKLRPTLKYYFPKEYQSFRYKVVKGDIERRHFGLSDRLYKNMCNRVDMVIHTAANVRHAGNYEDLERINVRGTQYVIDFCKDANAVLQYTSTASVHGAGTVHQTHPEKVFDEFNLDIGQEYTQNVYIHSKYVAEERVLQAREQGLKANIFRIGNLTWRFSDGKFQKNARDNGFLNRVKGLLKLKMYSAEMDEYPIDFTPVDECADAFVRLAFHDRVNNIYNLYNPDLFYIRNLCNKFLVHVKKVPKDVVERNMREMIEDTEIAVLSFYSTIASNSKNIRINNDYTVNELKKLGFKWSKINLRYLSFLKKI